MCCGKTIGHGETCQPNYLCGTCVRIAELEEENAKLKTLAQAAVDAVRYQKPEYEREAVDALAAAIETEVSDEPR